MEISELDIPLTVDVDNYSIGLVEEDILGSFMIPYQDGPKRRDVVVTVLNRLDDQIL